MYVVQTARSSGHSKSRQQLECQEVLPREGSDACCDNLFRASQPWRDTVTSQILKGQRSRTRLKDAYPPGCCQADTHWAKQQADNMLNTSQPT
jgi:hypothetical protein